MPKRIGTGEPEGNRARSRQIISRRGSVRPEILRLRPGLTQLHNQDSNGVIMTSQIVNLPVTATISISCDFWPEGDDWKGLCERPSVTVRGSSFEDAKKNMAAELQVHIERILRENPERSERRIA